MAAPHTPIGFLDKSRNNFDIYKASFEKQAEEKYEKIAQIFSLPGAKIGNLSEEEKIKFWDAFYNNHEEDISSFASAENFMLYLQHAFKKKQYFATEELQRDFFKDYLRKWFDDITLDKTIELLNAQYTTDDSVQENKYWFQLLFFCPELCKKLCNDAADNSLIRRIIRTQILDPLTNKSDNSSPDVDVAKNIYYLNELLKESENFRKIFFSLFNEDHYNQLFTLATEITTEQRSDISVKTFNQEPSLEELIKLSHEDEDLPVLYYVHKDNAQRFASQNPINKVWEKVELSNRRLVPTSMCRMSSENKDYDHKRLEIQQRGGYPYLNKQLEFRRECLDFFFAHPEIKSMRKKNQMKMAEFIVDAQVTQLPHYKNVLDEKYKNEGSDKDKKNITDLVTNINTSFEQTWTSAADSAQGVDSTHPPLSSKENLQSTLKILSDPFFSKRIIKNNKTLVSTLETELRHIEEAPPLNSNKSTELQTLKMQMEQAFAQSNFQLALISDREKKTVRYFFFPTLMEKNAKIAHIKTLLFSGNMIADPITQENAWLISQSGVLLDTIAEVYKKKWDESKREYYTRIDPDKIAKKSIFLRLELIREGALPLPAGMTFASEKNLTLPVLVEYFANDTTSEKNAAIKSAIQQELNNPASCVRAELQKLSSQKQFRRILQTFGIAIDIDVPQDSSDESSSDEGPTLALDPAIPGLPVGQQSSQSQPPKPETSHADIVDPTKDPAPPAFREPATPTPFAPKAKPTIEPLKKPDPSSSQASQGLDATVPESRDSSSQDQDASKAQDTEIIPLSDTEFERLDKQFDFYLDRDTLDSINTIIQTNAAIFAKKNSDVIFQTLDDFAKKYILTFSGKNSEGIVFEDEMLPLAFFKQFDDTSATLNRTQRNLLNPSLFKGLEDDLFILTLLKSKNILKHFLNSFTLDIFFMLRALLKKEDIKSVVECLENISSPIDTYIKENPSFSNEILFKNILKTCPLLETLNGEAQQDLTGLLNDGLKSYYAQNALSLPGRSPSRKSQSNSSQNPSGFLSPPKEISLEKIRSSFVCFDDSVLTKIFNAVKKNSIDITKLSSLSDFVADCVQNRTPDLTGSTDIKTTMWDAYSRYLSNKPVINAVTFKTNFAEILGNGLRNYFDKHPAVQTQPVLVS